MVENDLQGVAVDADVRWSPPDHRTKQIHKGGEAREAGLKHGDSKSDKRTVNRRAR